MSFAAEYLVGRPDLVRRVFEAGGLAFGKPPRGGEYQAVCPFHDDHDPSLSVNLEKAMYLCRACNDGGDAVEFFAKQSGLPVDAAILELRDRLGIGRNGRGSRPIKSWELRDIGGKLVATHHFLGYDADGKKIMPWDPKGLKTAELPLYGSERLAAADPEATVIVTEGEKAADALARRAFLAVGTVTGAGGTPGPHALGVLRDRNVVLWPDNDEPGRRHMDRIAASLNGLARSVRLLSWGEREKDDADNFFGRGGAEEQLDRMLAEAVEFSPRPLKGVPDHDESGERGSGGAARWPTISTVLASMPPPGDRLATGFPTLDRCLRGGLASGRVYTVIGPPHRGKTALLSQLGIRFASEYGAAVVGLYFDEGNWQAGLMMAEGVGFERSELEDNYSAISSRVEDAVSSLKIWLPDPADPSTTLEDVEAALVADGFGERPVVVIADSIQRVRTHSADNAQNAKDRADAVMATVRQLLSRHPTWAVLAAAKANRGSWAKRNPAERQDAMAAGLDSSAIEYDSDFLAFLDGNISDGVALRVLKNRPGTGETPTVNLRFDRRRASFEEITEAEIEAAADERQKEADAARWSKWESSILKYLGEIAPAEASTNLVRERAKVGQRSVVPVLEGLELKGGVLSRQGKNRARLWSITGSTEPEGS